MAQSKSPDRRPLLYGAAAVLILIVAAFLFWPRGGDEDESAYTFMPESGTEETATADSAAASSDLMAQQDPVGAGGATASSTEVAPEEMPAEPVTGVVKPVTPQEKMPEPAPTSPRRTTTPSPAVSGLTPPGDQGSYFLYVGSFSTRANAQKRVDELESAGVPATVAQGSTDSGAVYRVRVGYFQGYSVAKAYGDDLKRRLKLDYWIAER